jgi:hypothetical protein
VADKLSEQGVNCLTFHSVAILPTCNPLCIAASGADRVVMGHNNPNALFTIELSSTNFY